MTHASHPRAEAARQILFGARLFEDKLMPLPPEALATPERVAAPLELDKVPHFPGRPPSLAPRPRFARAAFPTLHELQSPRKRGEVLHFFANHELLALELMALALLRFPDAPEAFQQGLLRTLGEEQRHLCLYLGRMSALGVRFGELPLSPYFWSCLRGMHSPLEYVTQMSLTFEQANLDYSVHYQQAIAQAGDEPTATILAQVFAEEIGHVRHGVSWFNRWRPQPGSDWEAYCRLLPAPMDPERAKGPVYCAEARRQAGLSEEFVAGLERHAGSRGRPPTLWSFDPFCEARIARGRAGLTPRGPAARLAQDLETLPLFVAGAADLVEVSRRPDPGWLRSLWEAGFAAPDWVLREEARKVPKLSSLEPWGWCPSSHAWLRPLRERLTRAGASAGGAEASWQRALLERESYAGTGLGRLFSKELSQDFARQWLERGPSPAERELLSPVRGETARTLEEALRMIRAALLGEHAEGGTQSQGVALKAPYGAAGTQLKRVRGLAELASGPLLGWIGNILRAQGGLVIEPWLRKRCDLSMQLRILPDRVQCLPVRRFLTGPRGEYQGTLLGRKLSEHFAPAELALLQATLPAWQRLARELGETLREAGYQGPAGLDAMIHEWGPGQLRLRPLVELNPRWTMGRLALALEERLAPTVPAGWFFIPLRRLAPALGSSELMSRFPLQRGPRGLLSGMLLTNDPACAREVQTVLAVGRDASRLGSISSPRSCATPPAPNPRYKHQMNIEPTPGLCRPRCRTSWPLSIRPARSKGSRRRNRAPRRRRLRSGR